MIKHVPWPILLAVSILLGYTSCQNDPGTPPQESVAKTFHVRQMNFPLWVRNASIYQVNIRDYTKEGTFVAFQKHLTRLKKMGVTTIALQPIYPISFTKRAGEKGDLRAVADYAKVNPELGTFEDFDQLVSQIHQMNLHLILHWVPNHTGWDHTWISTHPEWYVHRGDTITHAQGAEGNPTNWYDVAQLNYEVGPMRNTMIESMKFWLRAADVDGFICDNADLVPNDFWDEVRSALEQVKPVLMIAESEGNASHFETCFQANYGWKFYETLRGIVDGHKNVTDLVANLKQTRSENPDGYYQTSFISNPVPDTEMLVDPLPNQVRKALMVLSFTTEGMPLLEGGIENHSTTTSPGKTKGTDDSDADFYTKLIQLKNFNKSLWNGNNGGAIKTISDSEEIYAFTREQSGHRVVVIVNCSDQDATTTLTEDVFAMDALFGKSNLNLSKGTPIKLKPWEYWLQANPSVATN